MKRDEQTRLTITDVVMTATVTVEQAASLLGIGRAAGYAAAQRGDVPTIRIGKRLLVPTRRLLELLGADQSLDVMGSAK